MPGGIGRSGLLAKGRVPPAVVKGEGPYLIDVTGRRLIDAHNNFTVLIHGHGHEGISRSVTEAVGQGSCFGLPNLAEAELAQTLVDRVGSVEQVRFTSSGTEAVQTAVRLARAATGRPVVVGVQGAYHGSSDTALAISGGSQLRGVPAGVAGHTRSVPFDDCEQLERTLAEVGDDLGLVIVDLMANYTGLRRISDAFLETARAGCDRVGAMLAYDEVVSLRHAVGGMQSFHSVRPDLTIMGKIIGGGLPIGAIGGSREAMQHLDPRRSDSIFSSGTFTGNPVTMAAGIACLREYQSEDIRRLAGLGERLREQLALALPPGWRVRGFGSLSRIMQTDGSSDSDLFWAAHARGALVTPAGLVALSTPMDEACVDELSARLAEAATAVSARGAG